MSQKGSQVAQPTHVDINLLGARVSTKESNAEICLVALGKIYHGASTIHCLAYEDDVVRVSIDKVIEGEAEVPFPTSEIKYVRQALNTFIAWPTPLVKLVSYEDSTISPKKVVEPVDGVKDVVVHDLLRELIKCLIDIYNNPVQFVWDGSKFGIPNVESTLFLTYVDVNEITTGDKWLNIAILQLWTMYMDEWSNSLGHRSLYGFLEPQSIHNVKDRRGQCEEYIGKWLKESQ
ncbi:hypothetical protein GmHk_19G054161 [Glycine max]|nr:hypothetical protein GmHk_19G054161 [Glycine max]